MKVFITGATGFVGTEIVHQLLKKGHTVHALCRSHKTLPVGVRLVSGDILKPNDWVHEMDGMDAVIHLVGIIRELPWKGVTFEAMHHQASRNVIDAAKQAGVTRFVHMSANGTRPNAVTGYHKTKFAAEEYLRESGLDYTIFRPSVIYGKHDAFINMLASSLKFAPAFPVFGGGHYRMQPVSVHEVAEAFVGALNASETVAKTFPLCGRQVVTYRDILVLLTDILKRNRILFPVPEILVRMLVAVAGGLPGFPLTRDQFQMLTEHNVCENREIYTILDIPEYDFEQTIRSYLT